MHKLLSTTALIPLLAMTLTSASGCASIINGTRQTVEFRSQPACASVQVNGRVVGGTPVAVRLVRDRTHHVRIGLPGYQTYDMILERRTSGWVYSNLLLGSVGLVGIVIDAISGAMYYLSPRHLQASALLGNHMSAYERGSRLVVMVTLSPKVQPGWRALGCLQRQPAYGGPPVPPAAPPRVLPEPPRFPRRCR